MKQQHGGAIVSTVKKDALGLAIYPDGTIVVLRDRPARRANPASRGFSSVKWSALTCGKRGERRCWNPELRRMSAGNGVYALRLKRSKRVIYVGESHSGRFYRTLLRHFHDPSGAFAARGEWVHANPEQFEVAWWATKSGEAAKRLERVAIAELDPLANQAHVDDEAVAGVPF